MSTPFLQIIEAVENGTKKVPSVNYQGTEVDYLYYQIVSHVQALKLMSVGLKYKAFKLKDLKNYYGLAGRTASDCLTELQDLKEYYKHRMANRLTDEA